MATDPYIDLIVAHAVQWWERLRPVGWSEGEHIVNPVVNTSTDTDMALALAIAEAKRDGYLP